MKWAAWRPEMAGWRMRPILRGSQGAVALGVGALFLLLSVLSVLLIHDYTDAKRSAFERNDLVAQVLDEHITKHVDSASFALDAWARQQLHQIAFDHPATDAATVLGMAHLRELALVSEQGLVVASTQKAALGLVLDLTAWKGHWPEVGFETLMPLQVGRDLVDLHRKTAPQETALGLRFFLPLVRAYQDAQGRRVWAIALLNQDTWGSFKQILLNGDPRHAVLFSPRGDVLVSSAQEVLPSGAQLSDHPVLQRLQAHELRGHLLGPGVGEGTQLVSWQRADNLPLATVVEMPLSAVFTLWIHQVAPVVFIALGGLLGLGWMTHLAWRHLREREQIQKALTQAQAAVLERERELSELVSGIQELIFRTDETGRIVFANDSWVALTGQGLDRMVGTALSDWVVEADRATVADLFNPSAWVPTGSLLARIQSPQQGQRLLAFRVAPLSTEEGRMSYVGSAMDVTDRTAIEEKMRFQIAFDELVLELSPQPILMLDAQGRITALNHALTVFLGLSREQIRGLRAPIDASLQALLLLLRQALDGPADASSQDLEIRLKHGDGQWHDVVVRRVVLPDGEGGVRAVLLTLDDVTDFREIERRSHEARQSAQEASRMKSEFLGNVSHELRSPLQSILGFSEWGRLRSTEPAVRDMFTDIHRAGDRMLALVNDLLDVARSQGRAVLLQTETVHVQALLQEIRRELAPQALARHIHLEVDQPDTPIEITADPGRLSQILRNVLSNALKFSPPEGRVRVQIQVEQRAHPEQAVHRRWLSMVFSDQGPGIPEGEHERIFDPFVQSSRTKDGSGGSGLGLTISRRFAELHGGYLRAQHAPHGEGATLVLELPLMGPPESPPSSGDDPAA